MAASLPPPLACVLRATPTSSVDGWDYDIDTGRVWRESGDYGFSRASLPFQLVQPGTVCVQNGVLTFLFSDDGATSQAAYQVSGSDGGSATSDRRGMLEPVYSPTSIDAQALGIEAIMGCAADNWLPLVQGRGGVSLRMLQDGATNYVLRDGEKLVWLDAKQPSVAIGGLCD